MPNPTPATYTVQIGPTYTVETSAELTAWARVQRRSVSDVTRQATERGLVLLREEWAADHGPLPSEIYDACVEEVADRGERQAARKRKYEREQVGTPAAEPAA